MHRKLLLQFFLPVLLTACATTVITPEVEDQWGEQMSAQVAQQIGIYQDPQLNAYVASVGQRLVRALGETPYTFRFAIVDQFEPNAFATPGGYIYISRGLLTQINHEDELAGVLAHEISHVTQRHHARQAGKSFRAGLFTLPGRAVGVISKDLGNMINTPVEAAGKVYLSSFSRSQETDADRHGMLLASSAGYEPQALASALTSIERAVAYLTGEQHEASFFDSHPTTPTRVADIAQHAASLNTQPAPPLANRDQLLGQLNGLWVGPQNPQQGIFRGQAFLNADLDTTVRFAPEWETINTPTYVAAAAPDQTAFIALGAAESGVGIRELADATAENMRQESGLEPSERRSFQIGSWPAELVRYDDNNGEEQVSLYYLFVASPRQTFALMAMGMAHQRPALRATVLSLRQLTAAERQQITGQRLRLSRPQAGQSLQAVGVSSGNSWSPEYTAIANGLPDGASAPGGTIKISREERYAP